MKCERLRGQRACFGLLSPLVTVATHWVSHRTILCPRSVGKDCQFCRGLNPKLVGYACVKTVAADGSVSPVLLAEMPPSLVAILWRLPDPSVHPIQFADLEPVKVTVQRASSRSEWFLVHRGPLSVEHPVHLSEVLDSMARLYSLKAEPGEEQFAERFGRSVVAVADSVLLPHLAG